MKDQRSVFAAWKTWALKKVKALFVLSFVWSCKGSLCVAFCIVFAFCCGVSFFEEPFEVVCFVLLCAVSFV